MRQVTSRRRRSPAGVSKYRSRWKVRRGGPAERPSGSGAATSSAKRAAVGTSQCSSVTRAPRSAPPAREDELAARAIRVVDGLEEGVVVIEHLLDPFGLESLGGHPAVQRVARVFPGVEQREQRGELRRREIGRASCRERV